MEIDPTVMVLIVVLAVILGIFVFSMAGSANSDGESVKNIPQYYSGGGCGR